MALTRAQYLAGNTASGPVLPGQPQGVRQGSGVTIATDGTISFNAGTATGVVTSVAASGGTTGLTFSGSPITSSGTLTLGGILGIANGGTGAVTRQGAANNILPSQPGNAGKVLTTDGSNVSWAGGGSFPNTTINYPSTIPGTATSSSWLAPSSVLTATGCIQFSVNGGAFSQGPTTVVQGNTVTTQWILSAPCGFAPTGTVLTGIITDGIYSTQGTITIDRVPSAFTFNDLTGQPLSSVITSNPVVPPNFNSTAYITLAGASLASMQASINGGAYAAIPASGTTMPINPGQSLQIRGTTGAATSTTYTATINIGEGASVTSDSWSVTTTAPTAAISQPSIVTPPNGTTNLNPALNNPAGITLISSTYAPLNGAGAQTSSTWEVTQGAPGGAPIPGSPFTDTIAPFNTLFIPQSSLTTSTNYFARVQYATTNFQPATSPFSNWSSFSTAASFVPNPGDPLGGGYFGGQINDSGTIYNLIVAPITGTGGQEGQYGGNPPLRVRYKSTLTTDGPVAYNEVYGGTATQTFSGGGHPMFFWCVNGANGPRSNGGIGGYTDWYIPAKNEMSILYFFLKPGTQTNTTGSGSNPNSVAPYTPNTNFGPGFPNQVSNSLFQTGGAQAFWPGIYWTSSEDAVGTIVAWRQFFDVGLQDPFGLTSDYYARAIRRVPA